MRATVPTSLLRRLGEATPAELSAIDRFLASGSFEMGAGMEGGGEAAARFVFRKAGSQWHVIFNGSKEFHVEDTLGAAYLSYLLHHPNQAISAFDLEVAIRPEKAGARAKDSFREKLDPETVKRYLRELTRLRAEREEAGASGRVAEANQLDGEIWTLEKALRGGVVAGDTGERARSNVNKALAVVRRQLAKGEESEREFGEHIRHFVSVGYQCMYAQPPGGRWD